MGTAAAVTPHHLATSAAIEIMSAGGNAIDAAIAANAVLGVVAPETCGVGGDLFALIHRTGQERPDSLNASGRAGSGVSAQALRDRGHSKMPVMDPESVTVPGCVDGWHHLAAFGGRLSWPERLAPALTFARDGFPASAELSRSLKARLEAIGDQPIGRYLLPRGVPPEPGQTLIRPDLADTLETVSDRDSFYLGLPGKAITEAVGGLISNEDRAVDQGEWVEPLGLELYGRHAWTIPPNSQGYLTLAAGAVFERVAAGVDPHDPLAWHFAIEAYRSQVADRAQVLADARFADHDLLSARRLGAELDPDHRTAFSAPGSAPGGTSYFCVLDRDGTGVSIIQSNFMGLGTSIGAGEAGFFLHNRGAGFDLTPGSGNELAPGKRPLHTLAPTLWTEGTGLSALLGTRGGDYQPQLLLQMLIHLFASKHPAAGAQAHPRWVIDDLDDADAPVLLEAAVPDEVAKFLEGRGHRVKVMEGMQGGWGPVSVILLGPDGVEAAADPRVGTASAELL